MFIYTYIFIDVRYLNQHALFSINNQSFRMFLYSSASYRLTHSFAYGFCIQLKTVFINRVRCNDAALSAALRTLYDNWLISSMCQWDTSIYTKLYSLKRGREREREWEKPPQTYPHEGGLVVGTVFVCCWQQFRLLQADNNFVCFDVYNLRRRKWKM